MAVMATRSNRGSARQRTVGVSGGGLAFSPDIFALGFCLLAAGVVWTLASLGRLDAVDFLHTWWPMSLVVWGLAEVMAAALGRRRRNAGAARRSSTNDAGSALP
jgi:membrane protein implicated in regulation of membrane protease activity